jgi:SEC-C motif-containing protein
MSNCPCGSNKSFETCCELIIAGTPAPTAEALMRSRYSAYAVGNLDHVRKTHGADAKDKYDHSETESTASDVKWVGLEIRGTTGGEVEDQTGTVEFIAKCRQDGEIRVHHERSDFKREEGQWMYIDGVINPRVETRRVQKVGRNDPCPCGSGKKYKKCCAA